MAIVGPLLVDNEGKLSDGFHRIQLVRQNIILKK